MALTDFFSNFHLLMRWLHVMAGIVWIGVLYFFNFVNIQVQKSIDDGAKKAVNPQLMPRALWWFRWGAMITFLAGLILFVMNYMYEPGIGFGPSANWSDVDGMTGRAWWITMGMLLGLIMWFNVWFIIWPAQKKLLSGKAGDQADTLRTSASKFSRINTFLSGPMLFGMLAPNHYGSFSLVTLIIVIAIAMLAVSWAYKTSEKAGKSV